MESQLPLSGLGDIDRLQFELQQLDICRQTRSIISTVLKVSQSPIYTGPRQALADELRVHADTVSRWTKKAVTTGLLKYDSKLHRWEVQAGLIIDRVVSHKPAGDRMIDPVSSTTTLKPELSAQQEMPGLQTADDAPADLSLARQIGRLQGGIAMVMSAVRQIMIIVIGRGVGSISGIATDCCRLFLTAVQTADDRSAVELHTVDQVTIEVDDRGQKMWSFGPPGPIEVDDRSATGLQQVDTTNTNTNPLNQINKIQEIQQSRDPDPTPDPEIKLPKWFEAKHLADVLELDNLRLMIAEQVSHLHGVCLESESGRLSIVAWAQQAREGTNPLGLFLSGLQGKRDRIRNANHPNGRLWYQRVTNKHEQRARELIKNYDREECGV